MKATILFLILISSLFADLTGKVVGVSDGDTLKVLTEAKETVKIRLYGIDCPEKKQPFGQVAKQFASDRIFGKEVTVKEKAKDRYGRTVGVVFHDGDKCLNYEIVEAGLAWCYRHYNKDPKIEALEAKARGLKVGLWQDSAPVPPWDWRKNKTTAW